MNTDSILGAYSRHKGVKDILEAVQKRIRPKIHCPNLIGSSKAFVMATLQKLKPFPMLYIANTLEDARYIQSDLMAILPNKPILFFPAPFKKRGNFLDINTDTVLERTDTLNRSRKQNTPIIITYPEALFEKVVTEEALEDNTFTLRVGAEMDIDFIIEFLNSYDFERTDFVTEPGSFSIRGGIIDVFSFASELPYRIELFEDKIESIRLFEVETQLSAKRLQEVSIIPNTEKGVMNLLRIPFWNFINRDTLIFSEDIKLLKSEFSFLTDKLIEQREALSDEEKLNHPLDNFTLPDSIYPFIEKFSVVELNTHPHFNPDITAHFSIKPQVDFNRNFKLISEHLITNSENGFTNLIFSDQAKQIERIYAIFEDIAPQGVSFSPIYHNIHQGFSDEDLKLCCLTEHQIFGRFHKYKTSVKESNKFAITLKELYELKPGDFITHIDHGVGIFSGLQKIEVNGKWQEAIRLEYKSGDLLYVNIHSLHKISRYIGSEGKAPKLNRIGSNNWEQLKEKTKNQVKDIARDLIKLYAQRKTSVGYAFHPDTYKQTELEASFIYEDTPDQAKATADCKRDMELPAPMDRLVCGDVGFGKTEVAIRAAFKATQDLKQVAVLVPTTILALQHYKTFKARLAEFGAKVDFVSRFKTSAQIKQTLEKVAKGDIDILIGTHRILSKDVKFSDLGLLIIDEEQKFGVASKEKLRQMKANVDTLTLSATPIPRTLQFSLMGARDMSMINTPPPNRQPISTSIEVFNAEVIREAIDKELMRGGQVYFVHNRIKDIFDIADQIQNLVPEAKVAVAHAQMDSTKLEELMVAFIEGYYDVFVSTNIVESGLDIPNANTMIINQAQNFGLSDLYQLRGRVGRSNKKAYCILLTPPKMVLTQDALKRLSAIEQYSDLGSGFLIAMKDLDIRGAGNILGAEQSGFIAEIGFEMYQKILAEAMQELKETEFKEVFEADKQDIKLPDTNLDTDLEVLIPSEYITAVNERFALYTLLNQIDSQERLDKFHTDLTDRFGAPPRPVLELMQGKVLKWKASQLNIDKISLKRNRLKAQFSNKQNEKLMQSPQFGKLIEYISKNPLTCRLEQKTGSLVLEIDKIFSISQAVEVLKQIVG